MTQKRRRGRTSGRVAGKKIHSHHHKRFGRKTTSKLPDEPVQADEDGLLRGQDFHEVHRTRLDIPSYTPKAEAEAYTFPPFIWVLVIALSLVVFFLIFY
ncbi:MAG: hypothetical protein H7A37_09825 [Chlamydiales bacterium]|nr:hypothetical protein [Chlamydiia bacterium]MCP5508574.1 hypothetical protein [Chlamydiales bacterium]